MTKLSAGHYVQVQVLGLPHSPKTDNVLTYMLDADVNVGDEVRVPSPDFAVRMDGRTTRVGYALGYSSPEQVDDLRKSGVEIRSAMPLSGPQSHAEGFADGPGRQTVALLREQAAAFLEAHRLTTEAADVLERVLF